MVKPRVLAILLIAGGLVHTSTSKAQMWGTGMWGGMQSCPYPNGAASGAIDHNDEINELQKERNDLRKQKRDAERTLRDLDAKKEKYSSAITDNVRNPWADLIIAHLENGYNCRPTGGGVYRPPQRPPQEPYEPVPPGGGVLPPVQQVPPEVDEPSAPPVKLPPAQRPEPRLPRQPQSVDIFESQPASRAPASASRSPASGESLAPASSSQVFEAPRAGTSIQTNKYDDDYTRYASDPGSSGGSLYDPQSEATGSRPWRDICQDGGGISKIVCRNPFFYSGESKGSGKTECEKALAEYRKVTKDADKERSHIKILDDEIASLGIQIGDLKKDQKDQREMEASCPTGDCYKNRTRPAASRGSSLSTILPLAAGILGGAGAEYFSYQANKSNNANLNKLGWPTQPYTFGGAGFPFFQAGIYGAIAGSQNGAYGCANGIGGSGGMMGPNGMMYPYGMNGMQLGSPFGYPAGMFGGNPMMMGGGMFNPGMGPWGGNGMGFGGGMGMGGMGMGGMPGMMGMGGMPMGMGGMGGMSGMGGMPMGMGFGGGMGGNGMGGYGMGMGGMPGMGGYGGGMGIPGLGGMGGMGGMPGMGGYGMGGLGMGYGLPGMGGMGGMMGMGGMPGMGMTGNSMLGLQYQQQLQQMQMQQYQMAVNQQQQMYAQQVAKSQAEQSLMTEYYSLMSRMQQLNMGGLGGSTYGGYGLGVGGGYNFGLTGGVGLNSGYGIGGLPSYNTSPYYGGGATPGRTR